MTKVTLDTYYDTNLFECSGHTGFAAAGEDILCSAVSVLCYTLQSYLSSAYSQGTISRFSADFSDGQVLMQYELDEENNEVEACIDAILGGFRILEESFPDYIETSL